MKRVIPQDGFWLEARTSREAFEVLALGRCLPFAWEGTGDPDWLRVYLRAPRWWLEAILKSRPDLFRWPESSKKRS